MRPRPLGSLFGTRLRLLFGTRLRLLSLALASLALATIWSPPTVRAEEPAAQPAPAPQPAPAIEPAPVSEVEPSRPRDRIDAQPGVQTSAEMSYSSPRQRAGDNLLMADGDIEIGGELAFVTADESLGNQAVKFTDVGLFRARVRRSIKQKVELLAGVTLLPKQPSYTDESVWQSASIGVRGAAGRRWVLNVGGAGGVLLGNDGWWWTANSGVPTKRRMHETLTFDLSAGAGYTRLVPDGAPDDPWLVEVGVSGDVLLHSPRNEVGLWIGSSFSVPVVHADLPVDVLDPQPRLDFRLGGVYALIERWDLFIELQVIDRGDLGYAPTLLPILDGGFDQTQLVFGLIRRISKQPSNRGMVWLAL